VEQDNTTGTRDRSRQKRRTRRAILAAAVALLERGATPTVGAVAEAAEVSRRTVYQYFPTQEQLLTEAALEAVRGRVDHPLALAEADDVATRLDAVAVAAFRSSIEHEDLLRTLVRLTVEQRLAEARGGVLPEAPLRGARRLDWIEAALAPVRERLDEARYERLVSALAVCIGFEALLVLRDIRGLAPAEAEAVSRWAARALLRASLEEAEERLGAH
jgi:AcrR family transcriptional regulator